MKQSALFFDIDGTLISEKTKTIPQDAVLALEKAKENGHLLFINTGRTRCSIPPSVTKFDFDGYMCGCGSYLLYQGKVMLESHLDRKRGQEIVDAMRRCRLDGILEGTEDVYFPAGVSRFEPLESTRRHFGKRGLGVETYIENGGMVYDKLFVYADSLSDRETFFRFVEEDMEVIDRGNHTYEVAQKQFSKATACEYMRKKLKMDLDQIYVFGDSSNDMPMFSYAEHAVAMGNHNPVLDPFTEYITVPVEEGGIARALEHYGLI